MKVSAPADLEGRLIACANRARLIGQTLQVFSTSNDAEPSPESLTALGDVADELADEIAAIERSYVQRANALALAGGTRR